MRRMQFGWIRVLNHVDDAATDATSVKIRFALGAEMYGTCCTCKESVVYADTDILARHDSRAPLTYDYLADADLLAVCALNAEVLRI